MIRLIITDSFKHDFKSLPKILKNKTRKSLKLFMQNLNHPSLNFEKLEPTFLSFYSIRVDKKYRVYFKRENGAFVVLHVGPHDIYRKLVR